MTSRYDPRRVFSNLVDEAWMLGATGNQHAQYLIYVRRGEPLPDKLKPGALIDRLSPEDRETLQGLTSDDVARMALRPGLIP
jgi:hypothetical protein